MASANVPQTVPVVNIPPTLQSIPHWVAHVAKKPKVLPGWHRNAKVNEDQTWRPWEAALEFLANQKRPTTSGLGFVFTADLGLVFIDFDNCLEDGKLKDWAEPLVRPFVGCTFTEISLSGNGLHVITLGEQRTGSKKVGDGKVEIFHTGRYVALTGKLFEYAPATITPMDEELQTLYRGVGLVQEATGTPPPTPPTPPEVDRKQVESALYSIDPDVDHDTWVKVGMALKSGLGQDGLATWIAWSSGGGKYKPGECQDRWKSFKRDGVGLGTLFHTAIAGGWREDPNTVFQPIIDDSPPGDDVLLGTVEDWVRCGMDLTVLGTGKTAKTQPMQGDGNIIRFFTNHPFYKGKLRYNERSMSPELDGHPVQEHDPNHSLRVARFCGWKSSPPMSQTLMLILAASKAKSYDPVAEWLDGLEWDRVERLDNLNETMGFEDSPETRKYLKRWLIGAVARAKVPGCRMNNMLVLKGEQGSRKTTFFQKLAARPEWFTESYVDMSSKDGQMMLVGTWVVEVAELSGMVGREREKVKAFISESTSKFRPPYGRVVETFPRRIVLGGTTNDDEFLRDPTGARRFWVIHVPGTINTDLLEGDFLNQIWAEARVRYQRGEVWWDTEAEIRELNVRNQEFTVSTSLMEAVAELMAEEFPEGRARFSTISSRFRSRFHMFAQQAHTNVLSDALRAAGWQQKKFSKEKIRVWFRPELLRDKDFHAKIIEFVKHPGDAKALDTNDEACSTEG